MDASAPTTGTRTDGRLFAIAATDTWLHLYPDQPRLLACEDPIATTDPVDYFDVHGRRHQAILDGSGKLVGLRETTDPPNEALVRARLSAVVKHLRAVAEQRLAEHPDPPGTLKQALAQLPGLDGLSLDACYETLCNSFADAEAMSRHNGSFWHNLWAH